MRFYFHLFNDIETHDEEGREFASENEAHDHAASEARNMAAESVRNGHLDRAHFVEVTDGNGKRLLTVTFGEVVAIRN